LSTTSFNGKRIIWQTARTIHVKSGMTMHRKTSGNTFADRLPQGTWFPSAIIFSGAAIWGFYWFPLRWTEAAGMNGLWAVFAINIIPFLTLLPIIIFRHRSLRQNALPITLIGLFTGLGIICYSVSLVYSTIMRATMLFYLTPIWSTILAFLILRERAGWRRWVAIAIGICGLFFMLSANPGNQNTSLFGDIVGVLAGLLWGLGTVALRRWPDAKPIDSLPVQYFFAAAASFIFVIVLEFDNGPAPALDTWLKTIPPIFGFYVLLMVPSLFALFWASQRVSPGRTGILMMSEVIVAGISAALIAGEFMSPQEVIGAALIVAAGIFEVFGSPGDAESA